MKEQIKATIQEYLRSYYTSDYKKLISLLDEDETKNYVDSFVAFAIKMDEFGESEDFLTKIKIPSLTALQKMSSNQFMTKLLGMSKQEIGEKEMNKMIAGIELTGIETDAKVATVNYTFPVSYEGEIEKIPSEIKLTNQPVGWRIHFKSGLDSILASFQQEIDVYHERKAKDQLQNLNHHINDLEKVTLVGYKNMNGDIVFEPRFKDGGDFSDGHAYVKVMRKYGYIDRTGELVIKPRFEDARNFSEDLAGIQMPDAYHWGFINKEGEVVIEPAYDEISEFNEGLCAVKQEGKWGYINRQGTIVIPCQYEEANDFWSDQTDVVRLDKDGEEEMIYINKKGEVVDEEE